MNRQCGSTLLIGSDQRQFQANRPNQLWVSNFTYVSTWQVWLYAAFVIDVFAKRIVSSMQTDFGLMRSNRLSMLASPSNPMLWYITATEDPSTSPFAIRNALPKRVRSLL